MNEVKETVRAAQEAEVRGELGRAVELLRRAEALYREAGNLGRADRMDRHASRLELVAAIAKATRATPADEANLAPPTGSGPVAAPEGLEAWCSFCCRPRAQVGPLVTGPTDAFICRACVAEALRLLR